MAFVAYTSDYDDRYPSAIDRHDRDYPERIPEPHPPVSEIPDIITVLLPYAGNGRAVFRCPRDTTPFQASANELLTGSFPSYYDYAGSSYTYLAWGHFGRATTDSPRPPSELWLCQDALDIWHNEYDEYSPTVNTRNSLYGDGHVKFGPARG